MPTLDPHAILAPVVAELQAEVPAIIQTLPGLQALLQAQTKEAFIRARIERLFNESAEEPDPDKRDALKREIERLGSQDLPAALAAVERAKVEIRGQLDRELGARMAMKARATADYMGQLTRAWMFGEKGGSGGWVNTAMSWVGSVLKFHGGGVVGRDFAYAGAVPAGTFAGGEHYGEQQCRRHRGHRGAVLGRTEFRGHRRADRGRHRRPHGPRRRAGAGA